MDTPRVEINLVHEVGAINKVSMVTVLSQEQFGRNEDEINRYRHLFRIVTLD